MSAPKRPRGTGSLFIKTDAAGRETFYGKWYAGGRQVKRRIGPVRERGTTRGLTRGQAEAELRRIVGEVRAAVPLEERIAIKVAGERYIEHLDVVKGRKPTTLTDYRIMLARHLEPFMAGRTIDGIDAATIRTYISAKRREGLSAKTVRNHVIFAGGLFAFAVKRG